MKKLIVKNYIQGLASFLDENNIQWMGLTDLDDSSNDAICIFYKSEEELFKIAFEFGKFYEKNIF